MNAEYITGSRFRNMMEDLRQKLGAEEPVPEEQKSEAAEEGTSRRYGILASVGKYPGQEGLCGLPAFEGDRKLMADALVRGFQVPGENIRILGEEGLVTVSDTAIAMKEFSRMLGTEDTLFFWFSGHGSSDELIFSDGGLKLSGILEVIEALPCRRKIVILDCCYAGDFRTEGPGVMGFEESIAHFAGSGTAVLASCGADAVSRSGPGGSHSLYTGIAAAAICSDRTIRHGERSLYRISREILLLMEAWNRQHPEKAQHPVFRSSAAGDIRIRAGRYDPYVPDAVYPETDRYIIRSVQSLDTGMLRRLAAFVILKRDPEDPAALTREIAGKIRNAGVFRNGTDERRHRGQSAGVIWCYFGSDESDMLRHVFRMYTVWTADEEMRERYCRPGRNAVIRDGILICSNPSYDLIRSMQHSGMTAEEYRRETEKLLAGIVTEAEDFIAAFRETENRTLPLEELQQKYRVRFRGVQEKYLALSDLPSPPEELHDWAEEVLAAAGCISDIALFLEECPGGRELWLIRRAVEEYYESVERLKKYESGIRPDPQGHTTA